MNAMLCRRQTMNTMFFRKTMALSALALVLAAATGCHPGPSGKYESANGAMSVDFKGDKVFLGTMMGEVEGTYEVKDDKITIKYNGDNVVLTRNSDGSLEGPMGKMTKK
jgi:hypothetical protein